MLNTARKTSAERSFGRPAQLVLAAAAAFTLLAGGTALASDSTSTRQAPPASSWLHSDKSGAIEDETDSAEPVDVGEAGEAADTSQPDNVAQGVHGACVSAVAHDETKVGQEHGVAVALAAHECAKGSDALAGKAKGAEKSAAGKAKAAQRSAAGTAHRRG